MENSIYKKKEVPPMHPGCSLAETGCNEFDNYDRPLKPFNVIPEEKKDKFLRVKATPSQGFDGYFVDRKIELLPEFMKPSDVIEETLLTIKVPSGVHPITLLNPEVILNAWIFFDKHVVEKIKEFPYKFQQNTIADGEFFRLENYDSFSLQKVEHFEGWRILRECKLGDQIMHRPEHPKFILEIR